MFARAGVPVLLESSVKKGLDLKTGAILTRKPKRLYRRSSPSPPNFSRAVVAQAPARANQNAPPLKEQSRTCVSSSRGLEPDPRRPERATVENSKSVAEDRRVPRGIRDAARSRSQDENQSAQMASSAIRHDLTTPWSWQSCALGNRRKRAAVPSLVVDPAARALRWRPLIDSWFPSNAPVVDEIRHAAGWSLCPPWVAKTGEHFRQEVVRATSNESDRTESVCATGRGATTASA